jgi:glycogen debranching enzyme
MFLWDAACYTRLRLANFALNDIDYALTLRYDADFVDIFEVRGTQRPRRGTLRAPQVDSGEVRLSYDGLDGLVRATRLIFAPAPQQVTATQAEFSGRLRPGEPITLDLTIACEMAPARLKLRRRVRERIAAHAEGQEHPLPRVLGVGSGESTGRVSDNGPLSAGSDGQPVRAARPVVLHDYEPMLEIAVSELQSSKDEYGDIYTSNEQFNDWVNRSLVDLRVMVTQTSEGPYPYAGIPWFNAVFGRDGIITAMQLLWVNPAIAKGVLKYLAASQAERTDPQHDAEPGKIIHEVRWGEMANLGEVPFGRYYGTVDATPLFIMLAGMYFERTGDRALIEQLWPNIERALRWIDRYGDLDGDGFVEYLGHSPQGLNNQGWKDSRDAVFHRDGTLAEPPIALCEVQGYVYTAKRRAAGLADMLGNATRARKLQREAEELRTRFEQAFWSEELGLYALALDGAKRPCLVRSSNAGQCLFTGIASRERGQRVARALMAPDFYSEWGIRTLAAGEPRYNPMSYHNGSIWPHDNSLIAWGMVDCGFRTEVGRLMGGLLDASIFVELNRMPELFCGFHRRPGEGPTLYPVACAPQAWAAGAVFLLLQACLGLSICAAAREVRFCQPLLPEFLEEVRIRNLRVDTSSVDLTLKRYGPGVSINIDRREGSVRVVSIK